VDGPIQEGLLERLGGLRAKGAPYAEQAALVPQIRTPAMVRVYYRTYATKDAAIAVACVSSGLQRAFMRAMGMKDPAHDRPIKDPQEQARHYDALGASMEALVRTRTTAEWKAVLDEAALPAAGVKLPLEMMEDAQALANGMLHDLDHPALGTVRVVSTPITMDGPGFEPAPLTRPFGSETRQILAGLGFTPDQVAEMLREGATRETP
jgi:crotonobetainyl-CoA:carnitine CoA-transferase CaiB-like acyl-CoA transferase